MNASTNFWEEHYLDKSVIQKNGIPRALSGRFRDSIEERQGIDPSAAALIDALLKEHWVPIRRLRLIGGEHDGLSTDMDFTAHIPLILWAHGSLKLWRFGQKPIQSCYR